MRPKQVSFEHCRVRRHHATGVVERPIEIARVQLLQEGVEREPVALVWNESADT